MKTKCAFLALVCAAPLFAFTLSGARAEGVPLNSLISNNATLTILVEGYYTLTNDVVWSSTNTNAITPIAIVADDVDLNLNGFTISATNSATSEGNLAGIIISNAATVAVTNGTIRGFRRNGISVVSGTQIWLGNLAIADIHNPTTNAPNFEEALLNPTAGISVEAGLGGVTVSNVVISNVSGGPNVMSVAGLDALLAPGLQVFGTTVTGVSNSVAVGNAKNLCNGMSVLFSPNVVFSNVTIANVVGNSNTAAVNGLVTYASTDFQLLGSPGASNTISGITNYGAVAAGISGTQVSGITVRNTRISNLFTGQDWTNNLIGHTVMGMVFAPLNGYPLGITAITVTNGGSGYTSAPTVTISNVANDSGSGAKAVATVSNGSVVSVRVTATGSNFQTFPSIAFSGGGGSNAAAIVLPFLSTPSFAPINVLYDTNNTNTGGNVVVADCLVEHITGSIDDAHGISFFGVTNVVASNVVVRHVLDGTNTLGLGGSKATGIEVFGNPMVPDSKIKIVDCRVENIRAISPGDLAANGFSVAGGGITFINCTASNVSATNTIPGRQPAYGYGFGWAPDIRLNYQYPAWNVVHSNSTAIDCDYGFDTFNHRNASYLNSTNINNRITNFLVQPSTPGQVGGTERIFSGAVWNQVYAATNGPILVPVWNTAQNNNTNGSAPAVPLNSFLASDTTYTVRVPGSYSLTNDVLWGSENPFATAPLVLAGNNISLDLGGDAIVGFPASFTDAGLVVGDGSTTYTGLVISNGMIDGFSEYGVFVEEVQGVSFSALQILNIGGIVTATSPLPSPLPAGFYAMLSENIALSNVVVSNVTSGVNSSLVAGVAAFACSNFTKVNGTISGVYGLGAPVLQTNNAVFGFLAAESPGTVCSNLTVNSISAFRYYKDVTGIAMLGSSHSHVYTSSVTGITNDGGTAQGINGGLGTVHMTVENTSVSHIRTGQEWTNNPLGHTALGMVFAPSGRPVRSYMTGITLTNSGSGYTSAPTVTLQTLSGDPGTNATARAVVGGGRVTGTWMLNGGSDYIAAPKVLFSGGGGSNAGGLVMPHNVWPYVTHPCGDITVSNCVISNVVGGIDDAHGISFFVATNVVVDKVRVHHVLDGTNTLGPGGSNFGGSKATGIESYGNPTVDNANFLIQNSHVDDIHAISPGDLAAIGFSAAGGGINFVNCTASNVRVTGTNRLMPGASPGRGYGFAWAPDIRVVYQYPAWGATFTACTASFCDVGFDTFNFQDSTWYTPTMISNRMTDFLVEPSVPFLPEGTVRVLYGSYWNEVLDAPDYPGGIKGIPVWNNAIGNTRTYASGLSGFATWAQTGGGLPAPGTPAYAEALFAYAFSGGPYQGPGSTSYASGSAGLRQVGDSDFLVLTENIRTDDPSLAIWGESKIILTNQGWNDTDVTSTISVNQSNVPAGTQFIDFLTPRGTAGQKFLRLQTTYVEP